MADDALFLSRSTDIRLSEDTLVQQSILRLLKLFKSKSSTTSYLIISVMDLLVHIRPSKSFDLFVAKIEQFIKPSIFLWTC